MILCETETLFYAPLMCLYNFDKIAINKCYESIVSQIEFELIEHFEQSEFELLKFYLAHFSQMDFAIIII